MRFPYHVFDLTHGLNSKIPSWDGSCGFEHSVHHDYDPQAAVKFKTHKIHMSEGIGTHMDAPAHCIPGGLTIDQMPLSNLIAPCAVIDVSHKADARYRVSPQDIQEFENSHGKILPGTFVMIQTGWERFWENRDEYRNNHLFPSVSQDAINLLMERDICGIGIDTLSPDRPEDGFPVHQTLLGAGKYIVENAANLDALPARGSFIMTIPMKIQEGTEAPVRLLGLVKN